MDLKKQILELLKDGRSLDFISICEELKIERELDEELANILQELVNSCDLTVNKKGRYMLFSASERNKDCYKGKFMDTKGTSAFVRVEGMDDIHISNNRINGAINGDTVLVYIIRPARRDFKAEGQVVSIKN